VVKLAYLELFDGNARLADARRHLLPGRRLDQRTGYWAATNSS
jgi:hypothetical protein